MAAKCFIMFIFFIIFVGSACSFDDAEGSSGTKLELGETIAKLLQDIPRFSLSGRRLHVDWDPQNPLYWQTLAMFSLPFLFLGLFFLASISIFYCCSCIKYRQGKYFKRMGSVSGPKICILVFLPILGLAAVPGIILSIMVHNRVESTLDIAQTTQTDVISDIDAIEYLLVDLNATNYLTPDLKSGIEWMRMSSNYTNEYKPEIVEYSGLVEFLFVFVFAIGIFIAVIGIISLVFFSKALTCITITLGMIMLPLLWIIVGASAPSAVFIVDMCPELEGYVENRTSSDAKPWFDYYLECNGSSPLSPLISKAELDLAYVETHDIPNKQHIIADLEQLLVKLGDLGNCTKVEGSYAEAKYEVCISILNLISFIFLIGMFCSVALFASLWSYMKYYIRSLAIKNAAHAYRPINQDLSLVFSESVEMENEENCNCN